MDAVLQSLLHTRMPQSTVRTAARDGAYIYPCAERWPQTSLNIHPISGCVADGTSHTLAVEMFVQAPCFPRLLEGHSNFGAFDLVTHTQVRNV